ncbi:MAG: DUF3108 domain-containing protein [Rhodanobacter sp.]
MTVHSLLAGTFALVLLCASAPSAAAPPQAFTASYNVSQNGQPLGEAQVRLRAVGDGTWSYTRDVQGTGGLAAMLGASLSERSTVRWKGDVPEAISYDYQLQAAIKNKRRKLRVDWTAGQVSVDEGKGATTYAAQPGMVERNTLALALGLALRDGRREVSLPVAVRQAVEIQHFKVTGTETVKVPAGSFKALRVERTDADRGFTAWYAPDRYPLPVKLSQHDGGDMQMELVSYSGS